MAHNDSSVIATSWVPDRQQFLGALMVAPIGLGAQLFNPVFNALFLDSVDLKDEFRRYYSVEYTTLSEYAEIRYGIVLEESQLEADHVFWVTSVPQIIDTIYDDNMLDAVLSCISGLEEDQGENQT